MPMSQGFSAILPSFSHVLLRLHVESWTYFLFGAAYVGSSVLLYIWDSRASERCNAAERAAQAAEQAAGVTSA